MADGIVGHEQSTRRQPRHDRFVAIAIDVFFGVEKAKGDLVDVLQKIAGVAGHQFHKQFDARGFKRRSGQVLFFRRDLERSQFSSGQSAGQRS